MILNRVKYFFKQLYAAILRGLSGSNSPLFLIYYKWIYSPNPNSVEHFFDRMSKAQKVFVFQVGANDGITHDPIHKFIKRDNWSGILLEPQPFVYEHRLKPIYRKNKGITCVNAAIGYEDGKAALHQIAFTNARWASGLASFDRKNLEKLFDDGTVVKRAKRIGMKVPVDKSMHIKSEIIDTYSPSSLIRKHHIKNIDLLMIDAEGFDFEVIKMFDMSLLKPKAIVFEKGHLSESDQSACEQLLTNEGYSFKNIGANTVAWQPEFDVFMEN